MSTNLAACKLSQVEFPPLLLNFVEHSVLVFHLIRGSALHNDVCSKEIANKNQHSL